MSGRSKKASSPNRRSRRKEDREVPPGRHTRFGDLRLRSYQVGAIPLINELLERMQLEPLLRQYLPKDDSRTELPTSRALLVLIRNLLLSREPIYGIPDWAAHVAPDLLDLFHDELPLLHDDRLGRGLHRLFEGTGPDLILAVVRQVIREFNVSLDELHNDSTTVSFYGAYNDASQEGTRLGRATPAITFGHSKARRPDLKQLLYTLTITDDGGIPVYFTSSSGNVVDDSTHRETWDMLAQLVGRPNFLYVADCKLASSENLKYLACRGGRFVTVLPATRREDEAFRQRLRDSQVEWDILYETFDDEGDATDVMSVCPQETLTSDGFRLLWYHSARKAGDDQTNRVHRVHRATAELTSLRARMQAPRTRFRDRAKIEAAVRRIMDDRRVESLLTVTIVPEEKETFRQTRRGRPTKDMPYVRQVETRFNLEWELNADAMIAAGKEDGIFPLLTNDRELTAREVLAAYKRQPIIEKRFSQFKTDFAVAPVYLKDVARIQGMLAAYFLVLLVQTLLERELRLAMAKAGIESLPLYPEKRPCARPTARRVLDVMDPIQRHVLTRPDGTEQTSLNELTELQCQIITLLGLSVKDYGR